MVFTSRGGQQTSVRCAETVWFTEAGRQSV